MIRIQTRLLKSNFIGQRNFSGSLWNPRNLYAYIKHEAKNVWQSCKLLYHEGNYVIKRKYQLTFYEDNWTIHDARLTARVIPDLLKMIPFSVFIIVPGAELTLPFFLFIFPNMIPSQFLSKIKEDEHWKQIILRRKVYSNKLHIYMMKKAKENNDPKYKKFKDKLIYKPNSMKIEDFVSSYQLFCKDYNIGNMNTEELKNICNFLGFEPWTGFKTISKIGLYPLSKLLKYTVGYEIPSLWNPTRWPFSWIQRSMVIYQLRSYLAQKRFEDRLLLAEDLNFIEDWVLKSLCRERGIDTEFRSDREIRNDLKEWIYYSTYQGPVNNEILLFSVALRYLEDVYAIQEIIEEEEPEKLEDTLDFEYRKTMERYYHYDEKKIIKLLEVAENTKVENLSDSQKKEIINKLTQAVNKKLFYDVQDRIKNVLVKIEDSLEKPGEVIIEGPEKLEDHKNENVIEGPEKLEDQKKDN